MTRPGLTSLTGQTEDTRSENAEGELSVMEEGEKYEERSNNPRILKRQKESLVKELFANKLEATWEAYHDYNVTMVQTASLLLLPPSTIFTIYLMCGGKADV